MRGVRYRHPDARSSAGPGDGGQVVGHEHDRRGRHPGRDRLLLFGERTAADEARAAVRDLGSGGGAVFTVWTIQRTRDLAILKALGATTRYLLRDALGQAVVLFLGGTLYGTALTAGIGAPASGTVPFALSAHGPRPRSSDDRARHGRRGPASPPHYLS